MAKYFCVKKRTVRLLCSLSWRTSTYEHCNIEIVHQNIRSIREKFGLFVAELCARSKLPEIIILTGIWISSCESSLYEHPNYTLFINSSEESRAGGVSV